ANLAIVNDSLVEGTETANLGLAIATDGTGGQVTVATGTPASHVTTIIDNDIATIGYSTATSTVGEATANDAIGLVLTITPGPGSTGTAMLAKNVTLNLTTTGGTATAGGTDYTLPGTVTFFADSVSGSTQSANLAIVNDALVEGSETATLGLSLGTDGTGGQVTLATGAAGTHTTTITDNDTATIGFVAAT